MGTVWGEITGGNDSTWLCNTILPIRHRNKRTTPHPKLQAQDIVTKIPHSGSIHATHTEYTKHSPNSMHMQFHAHHRLEKKVMKRTEESFFRKPVPGGRGEAESTYVAEEKGIPAPRGKRIIISYRILAAAVSCFRRDSGIWRGGGGGGGLVMHFLLCQCDESDCVQSVRLDIHCSNTYLGTTF